MFRDQKSPFYIDAEKTLKVTQFSLFHASDHPDTRIIDEDVQTIDSCECGFDRSLVRNVAGDCGGARKLTRRAPQIDLY